MAQLAEADAAELELAIDGAGAAAQGAAVLEPTAELRLAFGRRIVLLVVLALGESEGGEGNANQEICVPRRGRAEL